jgi:hypothetical protein
MRNLIPEEASQESNKFKSYYIIGIVIGALLLVGVLAFFTVHRYKKKRNGLQEVGEEQRRALMLNMRGIMMENNEKKRYVIHCRCISRPFCFTKC